MNETAQKSQNAISFFNDYEFNEAIIAPPYNTK